MDFQKLIEMRQSIRNYKEGQVTEEDLRQMVYAASLAPSGKNIQNWHFVAVRNKEVSEKMAKAIGEKNHSIAEEMRAKGEEEKANKFEKFCKNFTTFFTRAPLVVVVMASDYIPSGYKEYEIIGKTHSQLKDLSSRKNPGMQSIGAAIENFTLKAFDLGYGCCWLTSANYASEEVEQVLKDEAGFEKEGSYMVALLSVGIPEEDQKSPKKKSVDEILTII